MLGTYLDSDVKFNCKHLLIVHFLRRQSIATDCTYIDMSSIVCNIYILSILMFSFLHSGECSCLQGYLAHPHMQLQFKPNWANRICYQEYLQGPCKVGEQYIRQEPNSDTIKPVCLATNCEAGKVLINGTKCIPEKKCQSNESVLFNVKCNTSSCQGYDDWIRANSLYEYYSEYDYDDNDYDDCAGPEDNAANAGIVGLRSLLTFGAKCGDGQVVDVNNECSDTVNIATGNHANLKALLQSKGLSRK